MFFPLPLLLITTHRVVRISFVSIFLHQVSFVRSDKGFDRVPCKTVGTSQDLARLLKCSQDFLVKPGEKVVLARNNHVWRGKYRKPGENLAQVHLSSVMIRKTRQITSRTTFRGPHQSSSSWTPLSWPSRYFERIWQPCAAHRPDVAKPIS